jgi:hypothetical protein
MIPRTLGEVSDAAGARRSDVGRTFKMVHRGARLLDNLECLCLLEDHTGLVSDLRTVEGQLDVWLLQGAERFAGEFLEIRKGKIDQMEYAYPVFKIKQIHLWEREEYYSPGYPYYYPYPYWWYDPWWRPYPDLYWPPPPGW